MVHSRQKCIFQGLELFAVLFCLALEGLNVRKFPSHGGESFQSSYRKQAPIRFAILYAEQQSSIFRSQARMNLAHESLSRYLVVSVGEGRDGHTGKLRVEYVPLVLEARTKELVHWAAMAQQGGEEAQPDFVTQSTMFKELLDVEQPARFEAVARLGCGRRESSWNSQGLRNHQIVLGDMHASFAEAPYSITQING